MAATGDAEIQDGTKPARGGVLSARFQFFLIIQMLKISSGEQYRDEPARGPGRGSALLGRRYRAAWSPVAFPGRGQEGFLASRAPWPASLPLGSGGIRYMGWRESHPSLPPLQDETPKGYTLPAERGRETQGVS